MVFSWSVLGSLMVRSRFTHGMPEVRSKFASRYSTATVRYFKLFLSGTVYPLVK